MGYYAAGDGVFLLKSGHDHEEVRKICDESYFLDGHYELIDNVIGVYFNNNYHEEDVEEFLFALTPYIESGDIKFTGEDDSHWRFIYRDGKWIEQTGEIVYKDYREVT